jgi:hypothetical protein
MRVIIEVEGEGTGGPEVVLRSSSQGYRPAAATATGVSTRDAIDAGPAPTAPGEAQPEGLITTPAAAVGTEGGSGQSAGAAPSAPSGG